MLNVVFVKNLAIYNLRWTMQTLRVMFSWCQWCLVWVRNSLYKYLLALSSPVHLNLCPPATRLLAYTSLLDWLHPCVTRFPSTTCTPPKSPLFTYAMIVFWLAIQSLHTTLPKGCNLHKYCCWLVLILSLNHIIFIFLYLTPHPLKKPKLCISFSF